MIREEQMEFLGEDYQVVINAPQKKETEKIPIAIYVKEMGTRQSGSYCYSIENLGNKEVYSSMFFGGDVEEASEQCRRLGRIVVKKTGRPCYSSVSGNVQYFPELLVRIMGTLESMQSED